MSSNQTDLGVLSMKYAEMKKVHQEGAFIARKFLMKLDGVEVQKTNTPGCDLDFVYGKKRTVASVRTIVNRDKAENVFVETYVTKVPIDGNETGAGLIQRNGYLYSGLADFLFFITGQSLCIVPMVPFRNWVDRNALEFRSAYEMYWWDGYELRRHGLLVPIERIRREFAKGNVKVSIYQLKDNPNSDTEIDFYQEL